jgi:hypothetical protein
MKENDFSLGGVFLSFGIYEHIIQERKQFIGVDWLFDKKIGSTFLGFEFERSPFVDSGHKYDLGLIEIGILFDHLAEFEAMCFGKQHVADHGIRAFFFCEFKSSRSILSTENLVFMTGKNHFKHGDSDSIIVYDKYFSFHLFSSVYVLKADDI